MAELGENTTTSPGPEGDEVQDPQIADTVVETQDNLNSVIDISVPTTSQTEIKEQVATEPILIKEESVTKLDQPKEKSAQNLSSSEGKITSEIPLIDTDSVAKEQSTQSVRSSKQKLLSNVVLKDKSAQSVTKSNQKVVSSDETIKKSSQILLTETESVPKEKSAQSLTTSKQKLVSDAESVQSLIKSNEKVLSSDVLSKQQSQTSKQELQPENLDLEEILVSKDQDQSVPNVISSKEKEDPDTALKAKSAESVSTSKEKVISLERTSINLSIHGEISKEKSQPKIPDSEPTEVSEQTSLKEKQITEDYKSSSQLKYESDVSLKTSIKTVSAMSKEDPAISESSAEEHVAPLPIVDREILLAQLRTLMNDRSMLLLRNNMLQRRLADYYRKRNLDHALKEVGNMGGVDFEELYHQKLLAYDEMKVKQEQEIAEIERVLRENESVRDQHRQHAKEAFAQMQETERSVGIGLIDTRYGKRIPDKVVDRLLALQASRAHETSILRLRWLRARDAAARLERDIHALDTVAGGLRVADYHQLLLDSQTYMEKIEDREGELARYRVSCVGHGAAAAHAREKLRCLDARAVEALEERKEVERDYRDARDQLNKAKMEHDRIRTALFQEQRRAGLLGRRDLLYDYDDTQDEIETLKEQYDQLLKECQKSNDSEPKTPSDDWVCWK